MCLTPEMSENYLVSGYYDYRPLAKKMNIPIYVPETYSLNSRRDINFFVEEKFDLLIQGGWQRLFPEEVLNSLRIGALGLHGSSDMLPKGRGRSPMNWSLIEDKKRFIMHLFMIKPGIDNGDILAIQDLMDNILLSRKKVSLVIIKNVHLKMVVLIGRKWMYGQSIIL